MPSGEQTTFYYRIEVGVPTSAVAAVAGAAIGALAGYNIGTHRPNTSHIDQDVAKLNADIGRARGADESLSHSGAEYSSARIAIQQAIAKQQGEIHDLRAQRQSMIANAPRPHHQWEHAGYGAGVGVGIVGVLALSSAVFNRVTRRRATRAR